MKKNVLKMILDAVMTIMFIALMDTANTGLAWHEIIGLAVCGAFLVHMLLNLDWIRGMLRKLHKKNAGTKSIIMIIVDALLLVGMVFLGVSGIFISEVLFANLGLQSAFPWKAVHSFCADGTLLLIAVHLGLHWKMVMAAFRRMFKMKKESKPGKILLRIAAFAIVLLGIKATVETNFFGTAALTKTAGGLTQQQAADSLFTGDDSGTLGVSTVAVTETADSDTTTLNEFLSNLVCNECGKRCSLLSPQCGKGQRQAQAQTAEYEASTAEQSANAEENTTASSLVSAKTASTNSYLSYLSILGMTTTATHYFVVLGEKKKSEGEKGE